MNDAPTEVLLRADGIRKRFGATVALDGVTLTVRRGEVHALIGENGAGKSTLMKILAGAHAADAGALELDGRPFAPRDPVAARMCGIAMIYQELTLAPHLTIEQNVMLGREVRRLGWVRRSAMRPAVQEALARLGHADLPLLRRVRDLSPGIRQIVEIARALTIGARIVVMDEPTSSLARGDALKLFDVIRRLAADGVSVIYISHFLEEIREVAERFTVLRDGRTAGEGDVRSTAIESIIEMMVGRKVAQTLPRVSRQRGALVMRIDGVSGTRLPKHATFEIHAGEILGICGLVGAGRTELLRSIFGLDDVRRGSVEIRGNRRTRATPAVRLSEGVGLLSEDRKSEGLALGLSIGLNTTLSHLRPISRFGWVSSRKQTRAARTWIERLSIKCREPEQAVRELSGGNQQKVAIARLLHHDVDVLLLDEPTRGIDVGSKAEIYRLMGELAARGKALVFVSSYIPELLLVCDRIAVMNRGMLGPARHAQEWTEETILAEATRGVAEDQRE